MNNSIFKADNEDWSKKIFDFTPVEQIGDKGMYFKREDYFAPFGYGNINGAKLRQCFGLLAQNLITK